jgi:hypothetical protein
LAGAYNSNSRAHGLHRLTFVCGNKAGKINAMGPVVLRKNVSEKKLSIIYPLCKVNSLTFAAKKPQPLL